MVKVKGPLLSTDATGKLGNDLQVSHWKGRNVLGRRRRPSQPRTEAQQAHRHLMGFLASQWHAFTPQQRVTWEYLAEHGRVSPYNAYISHNMARYRNVHVSWLPPDAGHFAPSKTYPADEALVPNYMTTPTITGLSLAIRIDYNITQLKDGWGILIHHAWAPPHAPTYQDLIAIVPVTQTGALSITIRNLKPGLYQTRSTRFAQDGNARWGWIGLQAIVGPEGSPPPHPGPPQPEPPEGGLF